MSDRNFRPLKSNITSSSLIHSWKDVSEFVAELNFKVSQGWVVTSFSAEMDNKQWRSPFKKLNIMGATLERNNDRG